MRLANGNGSSGLVGFLGAVVALLTKLPETVLALLGLMVIDVVSGVVASWSERRTSSGVYWCGVTRKAMTLMVVAACWLVERATGVPLGVAVTGFYIAHEALSILENAGRIGVPLPEVVRRALETLNAEEAAIRKGK